MPKAKRKLYSELNTSQRIDAQRRFGKPLGGWKYVIDNKGRIIYRERKA